MSISEYHSGYICVKILGKLFSIPCGQEFYSFNFKLDGRILSPIQYYEKTVYIRCL